MVQANNLAFPRLSPHIPSLLAPFLFSPPLLFLSAQHDSIFRKKKPPPPDEYRNLIEKCQELCSEKHKLNTRLFTRCMIDCMMEQNRFWKIMVGQIGKKYKPTSLSRVIWLNIVIFRFYLGYRHCSNLFREMRKESEFRQWCYRNLTKVWERKRKSGREKILNFDNMITEIPVAQTSCPCSKKKSIVATPLPK